MPMSRATFENLVRSARRLNSCDQGRLRGCLQGSLREPSSGTFGFNQEQTLGSLGSISFQCQAPIRVRVRGEGQYISFIQRQTGS